MKSRAPINSVLRLAAFGMVACVAGCAPGPPGGLLDLGGPVALGQFLLFVIVIAIVFIVATRVRPGFIRRAGNSDNALSLLRDRYARGEIDREEFFERRRDLEDHRTNQVRGADAH
jgi:putative membrane protein